MKPRDNPFRTSQTDALSFRDPAGTCVYDLLGRIRAAGGRGAIIGPMGTGKSTLLRELATKLSQECRNVVHIRISRELPYIYREDRIRMGRASGEDAVCIDGADLLPRPIWWRTRFVCRRAGIFVVTSHARALLPELYRTNPTPSLLMELTRELLDGAPAIADRETRQLFTAHQGNIREALRALYDRFQDDIACAESWRTSDSSDLSCAAVKPR